MPLHNNRIKSTISWKRCYLTLTLYVFMSRCKGKYYFINITMYNIYLDPITKLSTSDIFIKSGDSSVGIATSYGLHGRGVGIRAPVASSIFSSPRHPDRLWGPPSLLPMGTGGYFPGGKEAGAWNPVQLVPRWRKCGSTHPLPIRLHGVVLNYLSTGTTLTL
jgi:hypothetical protein